MVATTLDQGGSTIQAAGGLVESAIPPPPLVFTYSWRSNNGLRDAVLGLVELLGRHGVNTSALTSALAGSKWYRDSLDTGFFVAECGLPPDTDAIHVNPPAGRCGYVLVVVTDSSTHIVLTHYLQLLGYCYNKVCPGEVIELNTEAETAVHELLHSMIYRTKCFATASLEEDLVEGLRGAISSRVRSDAATLMYFQDQVINLGGQACLALLGLERTPVCGPTVGVPANSSNCLPFSCPTDVYQQVYTSSAFPGPTTIGAMSFPVTQGPTFPGTITNATYTISLSTTAKGVDGLSTTFSENLGLDNTLFFSGPLGGPITGGKFTITGGPFVYDPSRGNLLLDVRISDLSTYRLPNPATFLDARYPSSGLVSRAFVSIIYDPVTLEPVGKMPWVDSTGLVTEFLPSAVCPP